MQSRGRARMHELWEIFADQFPARPWLSGSRPGALDFLAATVSMWSGAREALAASRPQFSELLARIEADPRVAAIWARHWLSDDRGAAMRAPARPFVLGAALLLLVVAPARADGEDDLVALINARRAETRDCSGKQRPAASPLAPSPQLAQVDARTSAELGKALSSAGYLASTAATIVVGGPRDAHEALRQIEQHYCTSLLDARYSDIGVSRNGVTWRINIARPLIAQDLGDWRQAGQAVLRLVNDARSRPRRCGDRSFAAAPPLAWSDALAQAALVHSRDMAAHNYFDHADPTGATVAERASRIGYRWRVVGENIAAGQGSSQQVVAGWLASPGHCENIMAREFSEMGAAYAINPHSAMEIYWTQAFGAR
jgi:hypothetical protein